MPPATQKRREYVADLARRNREFYGSPDGRGVLRSLDLIFEYRWIYIFELIQNALDASAKSISLQVSEDGDTLILQHDGTRGFHEADVEALSKVFRSTKSASFRGLHGNRVQERLHEVPGSSDIRLGLDVSVSSGAGDRGRVRGRAD